MGKYICAVGDSFVFGQELVYTHFGNEFAHLSKFDQDSIECGESELADDKKRFLDRLNEVRFSSLIAKDLGYGHFNYGRAAASQEGIKLQAYLLLNTLAQKGIDPADTVWLIGLTAPSRIMFYPDQKAGLTDRINKHYDGDRNYFWTIATTTSFFGDRMQQNTGHSREFVKEYLMTYSETSMYFSWLMNIVDTINLVRAAGCKTVLALNLMTKYLPGFQHAEIPLETQNLLIDLAEQHLYPTLYPGKNADFRVLVKDDKEDYCPGGHFTAAMQRRLADYLLDVIKRT